MIKSRLKRALLDAGWTGVMLAHELGVRPETVYHWCTDKGLRGATLDRLDRIAEVLDTSISALFDE